jgi:hypothetical protein
VPGPQVDSARPLAATKLGTPHRRGAENTEAAQRLSSSLRCLCRLGASAVKRNDSAHTCKACGRSGALDDSEDEAETGPEGSGWAA